MKNPYQLHQAEIVDRIQESPSIFTLRLRFTDQDMHDNYHFHPGQFNMLYLFGIGEIAISIVSDPEHDDLFDHTIRKVGRVTEAFSKLKQGDVIGVRGPYGRGWPIQTCQSKNVVLVTGGLGCAPSVSVIHYVLNRRTCFPKLTILQGVKKSEDLIWREQYAKWSAIDNTDVYLAADIIGKEKTKHKFSWTQGPVTQLFDISNIQAENTVAMMCGPEIMMKASAEELTKRGFSEDDIWLSMERNMQCAIGQCGHCQFGKNFVCKNGPIFSYGEVKDLLHIKGY